MFDCSKEIKGYHSEEVNLSNDDQRKMRDRRDSGRKRLENGLKRSEYPLPQYFSSQGSYAMRTMVQDSKCDYDIDDGVYFEKEDLVGGDGVELSPLQCRKRIKNALKDERLSSDAEVKTNCVRQKYPEGYHIDLPVYRIIRQKGLGGETVVSYQLASGDSWDSSDARAVTQWYNDAVGDELRAGDADYSQTRRITKLTKKMTRSREGWKKNAASGICISKLVVDYVVTSTGRDDEALRETWRKIKQALDTTLMVDHPVFPNKKLADWDDPKVEQLRDCLEEALSKLAVLDDPNCSSKEALRAWDDVFNTTYFGKQIEKSSSNSQSLLQPAVAASGLTFPDSALGPNKPSGFA